MKVKHSNSRKHFPFSIIASILLAIMLLVTSVAYSYDANDRLLTEGGNTYSYDENGNMISKVGAAENVTYSYDFENQLVEVNESVSSVAYAYDADGIRIQKTVDGTNVTNYLVDKNRPYAQVLEERDGSNNLQVSYIYGDDLISQDRSGVDSYYHYDGQLSTRALTDETAVATDTYTYDAFGNLLAQTGTTENNYLYTGEQYDPNVGFYYLRARYYDTGIGRFFTTDPWQGSVFDPPSLHKYLYVGADPVNNWDPSGKMSIPEVNIASAMSATLSNFSRIAYMPIVQIATRFTIPITSVQSLCGRGPNVLQSLARLGPNAIQTLQNAYFRTYGYVTQSQALQSPNWNSPSALRSALNQIITGNSRINPANVQYHHIVQQTTRNIQNFGANAINSLANVVPTSTNLHRIITGFKNSKPVWLPRHYSHVYEWMETLSWNTQHKYGLEIWQHAMRYGSLENWRPPTLP